MKRSPIARTTPMKRTNPAHKAENHARAYGSVERIEWVQRQPCVCCTGGPCQNAHIKTGGTGRKADARWIAPLCPTCHADFHQNGQRSFEDAHQIDLAHEAYVTDARYQQYVATQDNLTGEMT